jgi:hypothetical protein
MLVARPAALPGVSTAVTSLPRPGPCSRLEVARDVFWASEPLGVGPLTERARRRVQARARDCLGLESAVAAREASERFLARVETSAGAGGPAPFGASRPISLALMPEIREDVAHLQTSIDSLLQEVERLGVRRPARTGSPPPDSGAGVGGPAIPVTGPLTPSQPEARSGPVETGAQPTSAAATPARVATRAEPPVPAAGEPRPFVTTTAVNYRSGPSRDATKLGTLQEGTRVRLVADENGWASVRLHDGRAVFVASAYLAPIE